MIACRQHPHRPARRVLELRADRPTGHARLADEHGPATTVARSAASRRESVRCIPHAPRSPDRSMPEDRRLATRNTMRTRRDVCNAALCWRAALTVVKSCRMAHTVSYPIRSSGRLHPAQHMSTLAGKEENHGFPLSL